MTHIWCDVRDCDYNKEGICQMDVIQIDRRAVCNTESQSEQKDDTGE